MSLFKQLQTEVGEWSKENFPGQPDVNPFLGSAEEAGELAEVIRMDQNPDKEELDAVGDILVYLADFCSKRNLDYQRAYEESEDVELQHENFFREWVRTRGRLTRSVLKTRQGIRLDEDRVGKKAEQNALAEMLATLRYLTDRREYTLEEAVDFAWYDEVIDREWNSSYQED